MTTQSLGGFKTLLNARFLSGKSLCLPAYHVTDEYGLLSKSSVRSPTDRVMSQPFVFKRTNARTPR